jgi:hypothetical protein
MNSDQRWITGTSGEELEITPLDTNYVERLGGDKVGLILAINFDGTVAFFTREDRNAKKVSPDVLNNRTVTILKRTPAMILAYKGSPGCTLVDIGGGMCVEVCD